VSIVHWKHGRSEVVNEVYKNIINAFKNKKLIGVRDASDASRTLPLLTSGAKMVVWRS